MTRPRALLSVSDKTGIVELGRGLVERGWELLSTGGTARALRDAGLPVLEVSEATGHPEMMEGRVKTLHPAIHAGLLARRDRPDDLEALDERGYAPIDLVAVNLYPFRETIAAPGVGIGEAMEQVDIGGPTMIRAAAKNHAAVWALVDPDDYGGVLEALDEAGEEERAALRRGLAAKVFSHVSAYDAAVAGYLSPGSPEDGGAPGRSAGVSDLPEEPPASSGPGTEAPRLPGRLDVRLERLRPLRYGENPDQGAALYVPPGTKAGIARVRQLHGKELSYNNLLDLDGALLSLAPFAFSPGPAACIVKHTTPCGLALGASASEAYERALATDPTSAFGSVIAFNRPVDAEAARAIAEIFVECVVAPAFSEEGLEVLTAKKSLRLLDYPADTPAHPSEPSGAEWWERAGAEVRGAARFLAHCGILPKPLVQRSIYGGMLVQTAPDPPFFGTGRGGWRVVTEREPTEAEWEDLDFAWSAVFGVKSNAILLAKGGATLGIGAGQMSRVDSSRIAVMKAGDAGLSLEGATLASDAFFPFRDGVDAAAEAGVRAIAQPGGSIRDEEVIAAADEHGIAMVFTGRRLFRH